jgi:ABC-type glycerol-3-phosphate transport system permease component
MYCNNITYVIIYVYIATIHRAVFLSIGGGYAERINTRLKYLLRVSVNLLLMILTAYPLSKSREHFRMRSVYSWYYVVTILFSAGLIPTIPSYRSTLPPA